MPACINIISAAFMHRLCYREYSKRRQFSRKESDRVGLLRSKGGDDDIISDQFEEDANKQPLQEMEMQVSACTVAPQ